MKNHIVVIGGGMAGTAAAQTLVKRGYDVTIIEKDSRLGGRIRSIGDKKSTIELGAGFLTDGYTNVFSFLKDEGLYNQLRRRRSQGAVSKDGVAYRLSARNLLLRNEPLSLGARVALLSTLLKMIPRLYGFDVHRIWSKYPHPTCSVSQMLNGKYGKETINYFWQPILDGYCYWSADRTSEAVLTLSIGIIQRHTYSFSGGLQCIPETASQGSTVLLSHEIQAVTLESMDRYKITAKRGKKTITLFADGVVCCTPATVALKIIKDLTPVQRTFLSSVSYSATAVLARTYKPAALPNQAVAYTRKEGGKLAAVTITTETGRTLIKYFASGLIGHKLCTKTDRAIRSSLLERSSDIVEIGSVVDEYIQRWPEAIPEFSPRHVENLRNIAGGDLKLHMQRLTFAGDYLGGPFIEGAFTSGVEAAERLDNALSQ